MPLYIVIAPRNNDLKIRLDNVYFNAPIGMAAIKDEDEGAAATAHTITLDVTGSNIIAGGKLKFSGSNGKNDSKGKNQDNDCWLDISRNPSAKTAL
jgi:hypothetical protein